MEYQFKKMYFFATRNTLSRGNTISPKFLPLKNDSITYDSLFDVSKNLKQVRLTLQGGLTRRQHSLQNRNKSTSNILTQKGQNSTNYLSPYQMPSLLKLYNQRNKRKLQNTSKQKQLLKQRSISNIRMAQNHPQQVKAYSQQKEPTKLVKQNKQLQLPPNPQKNGKQSKKSIQISQPQLDDYVNQYLQELLRQKNINVRQQIQSDRHKFIQEAIAKIKLKMTNGKSPNRESTYQQLSNRDKQHLNDQLSQTGLFKQQRGIIKKDVILQKNKGQSESKSKDKMKKKYKYKYKSTQMVLPNSKIASSPQNKIVLTQFQSQSKLPVPSHLPSLPQRKIYTNTPTSLFISKVGKTFCIKQINLLNKTLQLQTKNRQRAQRFFRRKLINIQKQYNRILDQNY